MPVIRQNFYDLNGSRGYPIDDGALGTDDAGRPVPAALLVDCRLRFPETAGRYAFVGALASTPGLVTAIFLATDEPARPPAGDAGGAAAAVPVAAVTVAKPVDVGRHYPVDPLYPGTGGWVVFGPGVEEAYSGRFSSVRQSQLLARCARPYRPLPVPSVGKEFVAGPLTGLVRVLGGADVEVFKAVRTVHGLPTDCLVVRLADDLNRNVLQVYAGPCAGRPETKTCPKPGLELLNSVGPDCAGNIDIEFRNVLAAPFQGGGGVTLDLAVGLADACTAKYLPGHGGQLPGEFVDLCSSQSLSLGAESSAASEGSQGFSLSQTSEGCTGLPYEEGFDAPGMPRGWRLDIGMCAFAPDDSPQEEFGLFVADYAGAAGPVGWAAAAPPFQFAQPVGYAAVPVDRALALVDTSRRNVLYWDDCGYSYTLGLTCRTHLKSKPGTHANGGLVVNWQRTGLGQRPHYHLVLANASANAFELWYYNGTNLSRMAGITMPQPWRIAPDLWYEVVARTRLGDTGKVVIECTLRGVEQPNMPAANLALAVTNYLPAAGKFGLGTDRARCLFSFFELRET